MADLYITNSDVGDLAERAHILRPDGLILRREEDPEAVLGEPTPTVFQDVAFKQHTLPALQFEKILDNEGIAVRAANKARLPRLPDDRLKEMIMANLDVGRHDGRSVSTHQNALSRSFKKVVHDL